MATSPIRTALLNDVKGKMKETESKMRIPSESLLNRLNGPSAQKAGLGFRDKDEVKQIIFEASKGSKFCLNEERKDAELTKQVDGITQFLDALVSSRNGTLEPEEAAVDKMIRELEMSRDLNETIVVVDADAFFASCEELRDPSLTGTAFAVGGMGMLTTASYEARKYGCRAALPGFIGRKLCPHLRLVPCDFSLYKTCSDQIMNVLRKYGPMSPASLDEAYCSVTAYCEEHHLTPAEVGDRMRSDVLLATGLTVSAGITPNALLSKIAADFNKPNGQYVIDGDAVACMEFMRTLPIRRIPGIGRVTERLLTAIGVQVVGDIYRLRGKLYLIRKKVGLSFLLRTYLGLGSTTIEASKREDRKSVGTESTFEMINTPSDFYLQLRKTADALAGDLQRSGFSGRTITFVYKLETHERASCAHTLGPSLYISSADQIYREAKKLLDRVIATRAKDFDAGRKIVGSECKRELCLRLLGIRMTNLRDERARTEVGKAEKGSLQGWITVDRSLKSVDATTSMTTTILESDHEDEEDDSIEPDSLFPTSSDELWAQVGGVDVFEDDELPEDISSAIVPPPPQAERYVPFWTAGPSLNSRLAIASEPLAAEKDQLDFTSSAMECPFCCTVFQGTSAGLARHVDMCLPEDRGSANLSVKKQKRKKQGAKSGAGVKQSGKKTKMESLDSDEDVVVLDEDRHGDKTRSEVSSKMRKEVIKESYPFFRNR